MRRKIKSLLSIVAAVLLLVTTGCGAVVSTKMTVDSNFAGSREINAKISKEDLKEVDGGFKALEEVVAANIPEGMTYTTSKDKESSSFNFVIAFDSLEDYREKVTAILEAGAGEEEEVEAPTVIFENSDSYFKEGFRFKESFDSIQLLQWLINALEAAELIAESSSNWYERAEGTFVLNGIEYVGGSYSFDLDEQTRRCLSGINVRTTISPDGTYAREFEFSADAEALSLLADAGCDLDTYFQALCLEDEMYETSADDYESTYLIKVTTDSLEELLERTNAILQTENKLEFTVEADSENVGVANLTVTESLDGSYYLDSTYGASVYSELRLYENTKLEDGDVELDWYSDNEDISYYAEVGQEYTFTGTWAIGFDSVQMDIAASSMEDIDVSFTFVPMEVLDDELNDSAKEAVKEAAKAAGEFAEEKENYSVSFAGAPQEVAKEIKKFVCEGHAEEADGSEDFFAVELKEFDTKSKLHDGICGDVTYNLRPLIGESKVTLVSEDSFLSSRYYAGDEVVTEGENATIPSSGYVTFYTTNISIVGVILAAVSAILLVFGIIFMLVSIKSFREIGPYFKAKKAAKATVQVAPQVVPQAAPVQTPTPISVPIEEGAESGITEDLSVYASPEPVTVQEVAPVAQPIIEDEEDELL